jgi:hypothetical protein
MNRPLFILGTPSPSWALFARELRGNIPQESQDRFASLHDKLLGVADPEAGASPILNKVTTESLTEFTKSVAQLLDTPNEREDQRNNGGLIPLTDPRLAATAGVLASGIPEASFLIFIESPRESLARMLVDTADPEHILEQWMHAARAMLALTHRYRTSVKVIVVQECLNHPTDFQNLLRTEVGMETIPPYPDQEEPPALQQALAELMVAKNPQAGHLYAELLALSHPLGSDVSSPEEKVVDLQEAISEIIALRKTPALQAAEEENDLLLQQLHQVQEEIEQTFLQRQQVEKELKQLSGETVALKKQLEESKKELSEENDMLLLQLHQVQEELEHYFLEARQLQSQSRRGQMWELGEITLGDVCLEAPHRHLNFTIDRASSGERTFPRLRLRLVEHHGKPGLLFFGPSGTGPAPLHHWKQSGEEGGAPFMLMIPRDSEGAEFFVAATTSDLLLIREILALLVASLSADEVTRNQPDRWKQVAGRLLEQIDDLPERLHYDAVNGALGQGEHEEEIRIDVQQAWFRGRLTPGISFRWYPKAPLGITIVRSGAEAPLVSWPVDAKGISSQELVIDFSSSSSRAQVGEIIRPMTARDKTLLVNLIAELPNFLVHASTQHPGDKMDLRKLQKQARNLGRLAKKHLS